MDRRTSKTQTGNLASRRLMLAGMGAAALAGPALAQPPGPPAGGGRGGFPGRGPVTPPTPEEIAAALPLNTPGLEHHGTFADDVAAASIFWGEVFTNDLYKEREGALRTYIPLRLGDPAPPFSYMAIGDARGRGQQIDHWCALTERGSNTAAIRAALAQLAPPREGGAVSGGPGMLPDADGIALQLLSVPGGLAGSIIPTEPMTTATPIFTPMGLEHYILHVSDLEASTAYYEKVFGGPVTRTGANRNWIQIKDTRLGLSQVGPGETPKTYSFGVKVGAFDADEATRRLRAIGATVVPTSGPDADLFRFSTPFGVTADVRRV